MSHEERLALSAQNSGRGMSRVEIAQRALDRAQAQLDACRRRLDEALANEAKHGEKREASKEKATARALALLQADEALQAQARRILADLDGTAVTPKAKAKKHETVA